jgi:N-acyl-D-amino-acid deacylase
MDEGALGISTGLIYEPGCFASTEEIVGLAKVVAAKGGIYASHIRSEREELEKAIAEALHIGEASNCNVLISHLKAAEQPNWGKIPGVIKQLEDYNSTHDNKAWIDVYPYTAVSTKLKAFTPKELLKNGVDGLHEQLRLEGSVQKIANWIAHRDYHLDKMLVIANANTSFVNKDIAAIATELEVDVATAVQQILLADANTWVVYHCISPEDMDAAILWPNAMICTDSWSYPINAPKTIGNPHPRSYGAFTTYLEDYAIKRPLLSIEEAIYKITALPAQVFKLKGRGHIVEGAFADIVAFNWNEVKANATYIRPKELSGGVEHLWVNGIAVIQDRQILDKRPGAVLKLNN